MLSLKKWLHWKHTMLHANKKHRWARTQAAHVPSLSHVMRNILSMHWQQGWKKPSPMSKLAGSDENYATDYLTNPALIRSWRLGYKRSNPITAMKRTRYKLIKQLKISPFVSWELDPRSQIKDSVYYMDPAVLDIPILTEKPYMKWHLNHDS